MSENQPQFTALLDEDLIFRIARWGIRHGVATPPDAVLQILQAGLTALEEQDFKEREFRGRPRDRDSNRIVEAVLTKQRTIRARPGEKVSVMRACTSLWNKWPAELGQKPLDDKAVKSLFYRQKRMLSQGKKPPPGKFSLDQLGFLVRK